jgi:hypothetical protein
MLLTAREFPGVYEVLNSDRFLFQPDRFYPIATEFSAIVLNELDRVASSVEGTRNENFNRAAFTLGGLLTRGW